jgi:hypothetical protein
MRRYLFYLAVEIVIIIVADLVAMGSGQSPLASCLLRVIVEVLILLFWRYLRDRLPIPPPE